MMGIQDSAMPTTATRQRFLFGPTSDFLMLGGGALLVLPFLIALPAAYEGTVAMVMLVLAHVINHPHFAHSYQIFYRNFGKKIRGDGYDRQLQGRYIFAGLIVPLLMAAFFLFGASIGNAKLLGYAANMLGFFVGWHYVKQGYGILMVDSVLKRLFFNDAEKKLFRVNGYAVWLFAWLKVNATITERQYWGLDYYTFAIPGWLQIAGMLAAVATSAAVIVVLIERWRKNGRCLPYNGVVAYLVTLYGWILFVTISPIWLLVVPALHSLQYLAVVWRYQTNIERERSEATQQPELRVLSLLGPMWRLRLILFILIGGVLGSLGFWLVPMVLDALVPYDRELFGSALFIFMFWIFINVHHYFLDNVMWRRGNPEVSKYLFA